MTMRFESIDELKRCAGPEFVKANAGKLGINLPAPVTSGMNDEEAYEDYKNNY